MKTEVILQENLPRPALKVVAINRDRIPRNNVPVINKKRRAAPVDNKQQQPAIFTFPKFNDHKIKAKDFDPL